MYIEVPIIIEEGEDDLTQVVVYQNLGQHFFTYLYILI